MPGIQKNPPHRPKSKTGGRKPEAGKCNAFIKKRQRYCMRSAGEGTNHLGQGRCSRHGGSAHAALVTHGRFSNDIKLNSPRLQDLIDLYSQGTEQEQLNTFPELAKQRALLHDFVERYEENNAALIAWHESWKQGENDREARPHKVLDITAAAPIIESITRIVARIEKVRAQNGTNREELLRILREMAHVVELAVPDEETQLRIKRGWEKIKL